MKDEPGNLGDGRVVSLFDARSNNQGQSRCKESKVEGEAEGRRKRGRARFSQPS